MTSWPGAEEESPPSDETLTVDGGEVAGRRVLRRIEALAAAYAILAGAAFAISGDWRRAVALTAAGGVSIVALRSLEGVVRHLRAVAGEPASSLGWRYPLRLLLLVGLVLLLRLGWHDGLAVVLGFLAVPLALLVEAGFQLLSLPRTNRGPK